MSFDVIMDNIQSTLFLLKYYRQKYSNKEDQLYLFTQEHQSVQQALLKILDTQFRSDEACPLVVSDPLNTRWSYAGSKGLGEQATICSGLPWIIFRPNNIYGPRQQNHFVPEFIHRAIGGDYNLYGWENTRSWLYIDDCIDALVKLIHTKKARGEIINIGSNEERKVIILAEIILKHLGIIRVY